MKKVVICFLFILLVSVLVLSSCGTDSTSSTSNAATTSSATSSTSASTSSNSSTSTAPTASGPKYGGTLKIAFPSIPATLGWPAGMASSGATTVVQCCLETLLHQDNTGKIVPWLAESYTVADDLKSITFQLRKDVKFHDGSAFNAEVAKWNLDNYITAKLEPTWSSVDILDEHTVRVNLSKWLNTTPASFADSSTLLFMISKDSYDKNGLAWVKANPIGTGAFKFVNFELDSKAEFVKNPDYWAKDEKGNQLPYLDGIKFIVANTAITRETMMMAKEADIAVSIEAGKSASNMTKNGMVMKMSMDMSCLIFPDTTTEGSPWKIKEVREAAIYAIDQKNLSTGLGYGFMQPIYQIPPRMTAAYNPDFAFNREYDVAKAKELLAKAGYPSGFKSTLILSPIGINPDFATAVQGYFSAIGIQIDIDTPQVGKFMTYSYPGKWTPNALMFQGIPAVDITYSGGLNFLFSAVGQNWGRTPEVTATMEAATSSAAIDETKIRAVSDLMSKEALVIPVYETGAGCALQPYVMDTGMGERGSTNVWNNEKIWLNK
jgi:peptide/nickel transport system substrate-binding protein